MTELKRYTVWDLAHAPYWINVLCVTGLAVVGLVILNAGDLGVPNAGKVAIKTVHTWVGYVFALNLLWRIYGVFGATVMQGGDGFFPAAEDIFERYAAMSRPSSSRPEHCLVTIR